MHKLASILKVRVIVVVALLLTVTIMQITTGELSTEESFFHEDRIESDNIQKTYTQTKYNKIDSELGEVFYNKVINNNLNPSIVTYSKTNNIKNSISRSFGVWSLRGYLTYFSYLRFVRPSNLDSWIQGFLFFDHKPYLEDKTDKDNLNDGDTIEKIEDTISENTITVSSSGGTSSGPSGGDSNKPPAPQDNDDNDPPIEEDEEEEDNPTGNVYYIAKSGNDNNKGTEWSPWKTIQKAAETVVAGDTVIVKKGYYNEQIIPENSGKTGNYITYTTYKNDVVSVDGSGFSISWGGLFHIEDLSYIKISGFDIKNSPCFGVYVAGSLSNNIIIENCNFKNIASSAIQIFGRNCLRQIHDITIRNNYANNICYNKQQEGISLAGVKNFEIHDNYITNCPKHAIDVKDGCAKGQVFNNKVNATKGNGIYCDAYDLNSYGIDIYENIVWGKKVGITLGTELGGSLYDIEVYDNIIFTSGNGFQINNHDEVEGSHRKIDLKVSGNIFHGTTIGILITDDRDNFNGLTISDNIFNCINSPIYLVSLKESDINMDNNYYNKEVNIDFEELMEY